MNDPYAAPVVDRHWVDAEIKPVRDSNGGRIVVMVDGAVVVQLSPAKVKAALRLLGE